MKKVYFINHDYNMHNRQSDGVEFCVISNSSNKKIHFYCDTYSAFWNSIFDVGNPDKCCNFNKKIKIRPVTLPEICDENLCEHVDGVKEYTVHNNKIVDTKIINLK